MHTNVIRNIYVKYKHRIINGVSVIHFNNICEVLFNLKLLNNNVCKQKYYIFQKQNHEFH